MMTGTIPLICLWASVVGSIVSIVLHLRTPWRATLLGRHLAAYLVVVGLFYLLILVGSYLGVPKWWGSRRRSCSSGSPS